MNSLKKVLVICGSTRQESSNLHIIKAIKKMAEHQFVVQIFEELDTLPHFNPDLDKDPLDINVVKWRQILTEIDGILICTPEYVFSLPGTLKNALEWLVSTTILSKKPTALITASGQGVKAHEQLLLIMKTIEARFTEDTQLHISGIRAKVDQHGILIDGDTMVRITHLINHFEELLIAN